MAISAGFDIRGTHGSPIECAPTPIGVARPQFRLSEPLGGGVDSGGEKLEEGPQLVSFNERKQTKTVKTVKALIRNTVCVEETSMCGKNKIV